MAPQVITRPAEWNGAAAALLASSEGIEALRAIKADVCDGAAVLIHVERRSAEAVELLAAVVLRVEHDAAGGAEGVIVSAVGRADFDLTESVLPAIEARFQGVDSIRLHTVRPGLCRKLARQGYAAAEIVMRKRVQHGR